MELKKIISFLACPCCGADCFEDAGKTILCRACSNVFNIIEGVPILLKKDNLNLQESNQAAWFDKHYSGFSIDTYNLENWRQSMLKRISGYVVKEKVETYLDIGCGATGYTVIESARRNKWCSFGMDISVEAALKANFLAKKEGVEDIAAFVVGSAESPPFKADVFDYISAISLLEHLEHDVKAIKSFYKLLRNRGHIYICVPNSYKRIWFFLWPVYFYFDRKIGHIRHYSIEALTAKMADNGCFELENKFYNGHIIKFVQIFLDKIRLIDEKLWWYMEEKDINNVSSGVQLNATFIKNK